ncbi:hypothetical protein [Alkalicoccobacillus porphyridii]|uniref:Uncharacterized protein n=1 Tax=Alkalicoccobacillus porphyridii TaxID=2597270 RepID=A0A553ZX60_9BACI|nr:hypothetical protein [Alkalicoccobacillus porphyridii]TSB46032.1 hypothetical protein FN960_14125 [Alkalicoccobacillus porphyridii]
MNEEEKKKQLERMDTAIDEIVILYKEKRISLSTFVDVKKSFEEKKVSLLVENKAVEIKEPVINSEQKPTPVQREPVKKAPKPAPPKPSIIKKERSPEEKRKRRLTYILTSGVALLLLGGVLLALTNWLVLQATTKVFLISGIALVFAGMSYLAHRLKIKQTMLAFLMLFAFFVPIVFFSISYYGIFGSYLSMGGEGSMLFAALASLTCAALYAFLYSIEAHRVFQIVTLVATGVTSLYAAGFIASTVEVYVLILAVFVFVQLLLWRPIATNRYVKSYRSLLPWFVLSQLLLVALIQMILFNWSNLGFFNYMLIGTLFFLLACRHAPYRGLSIPAVLSFSIGLTGFIFTAEYIQAYMYAIVVLVLPAALYSVWMIERRSERGAMIYLPVQIMFYVSVVFTHLFGQIMLLVESTTPNLYFLTVSGAALLLLLSGWQAKKRLALFFSYLLSFYTVWFLFVFYVPDLITRSIIVSILFLGAYALTVFAKKVDTRLIRNPVKLVAGISFIMVVLELGSEQEWIYTTVLLAVMSVLSSLFALYEQKSFKKVTGIAGVSALFLATITGYSAFWGTNVSSLNMPLEWANHYLAASVLLVGMYFVYKRLQGVFIANLSFIGGGALYLIMLFQVMTHYSLFSTVFPELLTLHAIAGLGYFLLATLVVFKKKEFYWGVFAFSLFVYLSFLHYPFSDSPLIYWLVLLFVGGIFSVMGRAMKKKTAYGGKVFFINGQLLVIIVSIIYMPAIYVEALSPHGLMIPMAFLLAEIIKPLEKRIRTLQSIAFAVLLLLHNMIWFDHLSFVTISDSLLLTGGLILLSTMWRPISYQSKALLVSLGMLNTYPLGIMAAEAQEYGLVKIAIVLIISAGTIYYIEEKWRKDLYSLIPLLLASLVVVTSSVETLVSVILLILLAFATKAAGVHYIGWSLFNQKRFNVYQLTSTILVLTASIQLRVDTSFSTEVELVMATVLFAYLLLLFAKEKNQHIRYVKAASILIGFYYPYHLFISLVPVPDEFMSFVYIVPCILLVSLLLRLVSKDQSWRQPVEMVVVVFGFIGMSLSTLANQTLYGSLTLSILAILAILAGFYLKYAAYFVTGTVALLVNTLYATRAFWASVPWWIYLMAGGLILIGFATYQELKKREEDTTMGDQWRQFIYRIKNYFKNWN